MATYVPGVETYLPDIKPFTPDYKFLSAVLDVRTDKYNTNWKATNDLYNKVVYADLSRTDTKEQRDQYINQIAPSLEKIAGMDLSMIQNADSAQAVFAPFFEDDLIVSDIMHTSNYRKEMDYANRLIDSPDQEQRMKYNEDGVRGLQYHMEDFITSAPDKAMKMGLPQFVEGANMMVMAQKILGEMKPPLKMKKDSTQGDWIITQQNGSLVFPAAKAYIEQALLNDPRIQKFYKNQAFVRSRNRAAEGIANGEFATVEQGQAAWAEETINRITEQNQYYLEKESIQAAEQKAINDNYKNIEESNGIVPGSDDDKAKNQQLSMYERTKAALEARENVKQLSNEPVKDFQSTLAKAYRLYQAGNIGRDIDAAAAEFASRDSEYTIKVNPLVQDQKNFQYDMAKISQQHANAKELKILQGDIDYALADAKGEIVGAKSASELQKEMEASAQQAVVGDATNSEFNVGEDNLPDANTDMDGKLIEDIDKAVAETDGKQLDKITRILKLLNPAGNINAANEATQQYTIKIKGENFTGGIDQIKNKLGEKNSNGTYKYQTDIQNLYNEKIKILSSKEEMAKYPRKSESEEYGMLIQEIFGDKGLNSDIEIQKMAVKTLNNRYKKTHDAVLELVKSNNPNVKSLMEKGGMPGIYETLTSGLHKQLSPEEYVQKVTKLVEQGKIKNIDLTGWDTGTSNEDYTSFYTYNRVEMEEQRRIFNSKTPMFNSDGTPAIQAIRGNRPIDMKHGGVRLDNAAIKDEALKVYNAIKEKTNSALTGHESEYGEFETGTYKGFMNGRTGASDMVTSPVYRSPIDPLSKTSAGQSELSYMMRQKRMLESEGKNVSFVIGNLSDKKGNEPIANEELAQRAYNAYIADMRTWTGNSKRSNSAAIAPRSNISYSTVMGSPEDGKKTTAGYTINGFNEWLASKVKGTSKDDGTGEYGLFEKEEVIALKNGISMVFDKDLDINPKARQYTSAVLTAVEASGKNFAEFMYPGVDGMTPTATYRIVKTGTEQYYATYKVNIYQPDGTYLPSDWEQVPINISPFDSAEKIDLQIAKMKENFENLKNLNKTAWDKNSAVNGKGNKK